MLLGVERIALDKFVPMLYAQPMAELLWSHHFFYDVSQFSCVDFIDDNNGWLVEFIGTMAGLTRYFRKTTDGGTSWEIHDTLDAGRIDS